MDVYIYVGIYMYICVYGYYVKLWYSYIVRFRDKYQ